MHRTRHGASSAMVAGRAEAAFAMAARVTAEVEALDRPRSWVIAEAIRSYRGASPNPAPAPPGAAEVAAARRQHLLADLRRTPEERLRRAAALLRLAPGSGARRRAQIIGFDSLEDFAAWKRARRVEGLNPD